MKQSTIEIITERMALARERHGEFRAQAHVLDTIRQELAEAEYAVVWESRLRFVSELLDIATVAIRAAEQIADGAEGREP